MDTIALTNGMIVKISETDYDTLSQYKWMAVLDSGKWYAIRTSPPYIRMHRMILDAKPGQTVDHKNGDTMDNTRSNIRLCTIQQNVFNKSSHPKSTSKYKGVSWCNTTQKWAAQICINRKRIHLGRYELEDDAARAYDKKAGELFGEFARLNFTP